MVRICTPDPCEGRDIKNGIQAFVSYMNKPAAPNSRKCLEQHTISGAATTAGAVFTKKTGALHRPLGGMRGAAVISP